MAEITRGTIALIWQQMSVYVVYKLQPDELAMKRLAMFGCSALMLAHSAQSPPRGNSYAGALQQSSLPKFVKSAALLAARLLVASFVLWSGAPQILRIMVHNWAVVFRHPYHEGHSIKHDGHDNNWLLAEFALGLPFALGFKTSVVTRLMIATLLLEAVTCWQFWRQWPTWQYTAHVRSHFATNLGVSGGLLLLQCCGAGKFTLDQALKKQE
ncbi:hypothetical protein WJX79_006016 [Trebouxia sp. C0005]